MVVFCLEQPNGTSESYDQYGGTSTTKPLVQITGQWLVMRSEKNPPHVAQGNFAEINKILLKLLRFSKFFINFDNM